MDPRDRADETLARARARGRFVVTPDSATSPMDAANTVRIPREVVAAAERGEQNSTRVLARPEQPGQQTAQPHNFQNGQFQAGQGGQQNSPGNPQQQNFPAQGQNPQAQNSQSQNAQPQNAQHQNPQAPQNQNPQNQNSQGQNPQQNAQGQHGPGQNGQNSPQPRPNGPHTGPQPVIPQNPPQQGGAQQSSGGGQQGGGQQAGVQQSGAQQGGQADQYGWPTDDQGGDELTRQLPPNPYQAQRPAGHFGPLGSRAAQPPR